MRKYFLKIHINYFSLRFYMFVQDLIWLVCKDFVIMFHKPFLDTVNLSNSVDTASEVFQ